MRVIPAQDFNLGSDVTVDVFDPLFGGIITFNKVTGFVANAQEVRLTSRGLDGQRRDHSRPDGWEGTLSLDRADSVADDYFARREEAHFQGRVIPGATITQTVLEVGGGITQYRFENVTMVLSQGGEARGDSKIEQQISWTASRRRKVI